MQVRVRERLRVARQRLLEADEQPWVHVAPGHERGSFAGVLTDLDDIEPHGFGNRLVMIQACFSGQFVPALASPGTVVITAASADKPSFGCDPGNDWTLFGDALVNRALREPGPLLVQLGTYRTPN